MKTSSAKAKGKTWDNGQGYLKMWTDGREVYVHRYVIEQHTGRRLNHTEQVHHVNGNTKDNRLENLQLVTPSYHGVISGLLAKGRPKPTHVGQNSRKYDKYLSCVRCKKDVLQRYGKRRTLYCSKECRHENQ